MSASASGPHPPPADGGTETEFYESHGPGKGIYATIDEDGFVEVKINTEGTGVRGIWGMWPTGTNLDKVNELTAQGVPLGAGGNPDLDGPSGEGFRLREVRHPRRTHRHPGGLHEDRRPIRQGAGFLLIGRGDEGCR
jgi:hypothetical protein